MQEGGNHPLLVQTVFLREVERVHAGEMEIVALDDEPLDRRRGVGIRRLAERGEQGLGFGHKSRVRLDFPAAPPRALAGIAGEMFVDGARLL